MNKKISFPIAIIIIIVCAVLTGIITWQYRFIPEIEIPPFTPSEKPPEDETADWKTCSTNSDCIIVKGDCCGCGMGGKATTINKNFKEEWEDKLSKECKDITCIAVISDDPSCFQETKCINNTCQLIEE